MCSDYEHVGMGVMCRLFVLACEEVHTHPALQCMTV